MSHFEKVSFEQWKADCGVRGLPDSELREWFDSIKLPRQATVGSAGMDFYMQFNLDFESGSRLKIATGVRWVTDPGERDRVLLIVPRSGLGFRYGLRLPNTTGVIDADYCDAGNEGHILVCFENPSSENVKLEAGTPFVQGIIVRYEVPEGAGSEEVRTGGFGSTSGQ
jgi:dUTP pyrophosphatase